jgi:hypothetical protein
MSCRASLGEKCLPVCCCFFYISDSVPFWQGVSGKFMISLFFTIECWAISMVAGKSWIDDEKYK